MWLKLVQKMHGNNNNKASYQVKCVVFNFNEIEVVSLTMFLLHLVWQRYVTVIFVLFSEFLILNSIVLT